MILTSKQASTHEGALLWGRPNGQKSGDVDKSMSDHGKPKAPGLWEIPTLFLDSRRLQNSLYVWGPGRDVKTQKIGDSVFLNGGRKKLSKKGLMREG